MKYLGLDYGTTNSLLYEYDISGIKETCNIPSAVRVANGAVKKVGRETWDDPERNGEWNVDLGFVKSPKNMINDLESSVSGVTYREMIQALFCIMLDKNIDADSHITLSYPNGYSKTNLNNTIEILNQCIKEKFKDFPKENTHWIPESVAAALYYTHKHINNLLNDCYFVVCNIGEETTDLSIIELNKAQRNLTFRVLEGVQHKIGGNDFSKALEEHFGDRFPANLTNSQKKNLTNYIKCRLSIIDQFNDFSVAISREEFIRSITKLLNQLEATMAALLKKSKFKYNNIYLLPIGGSCRIPAVRELLEKVFNGAHQTYNEEKNIFDSAAQGAAIYSAWRAQALGNTDYKDIYIVQPYDPSVLINKYLDYRNLLFHHASDDVDRNVLMYDMCSDSLNITLFYKTIYKGRPQVKVRGSHRINNTDNCIDTVLTKVIADVYSQHGYHGISDLYLKDFVLNYIKPILFETKYIEEESCIKLPFPNDLQNGVFEVSIAEVIQHNEFKMYVNDISIEAIKECSSSLAGSFNNIDVVVFSGSTPSIKIIQEAIIAAVKLTSKSNVVIPVEIDKNNNSI